MKAIAVNKEKIEEFANKPPVVREMLASNVTIEDFEQSCEVFGNWNGLKIAVHQRDMETSLKATIPVQLWASAQASRQAFSRATPRGFALNRSGPCLWSYSALNQLSDEMAAMGYYMEQAGPTSAVLVRNIVDLLQTFDKLQSDLPEIRKKLDVGYARLRREIEKTAKKRGGS